jgi:hypothetical protein
MFLGPDIIAVARQHIGEDYILGAVAPLANTQHRGPWDCAEFVSWCAYQAYGIVYAVRPPDPRLGESYSGWWYEDARNVGREVTVAKALETEGAILVRKPRSQGSPRIGHVAISLGNGSTIEAKDRATGVAEVRNAASRLWDLGVYIPGVSYAEAGQGAGYQQPQNLIFLDNPFQRGPTVSAVQRALLAAGINPGGIDGIFGQLTHAAVVTFQTRQGLVADGVVGEQTAVALGLTFPIQPRAEDLVAANTADNITILAAARTAVPDPEAEARPGNADPMADRAEPVTFTFETSHGKIFAVPSAGEKFYLGYSVRYNDDMERHGLAQKLSDMTRSARYDRTAAAAKLGNWAHFLWPTIVAESDGYFGRINSYDRAAFTFGCYQLAAHTPEENLILLFRRLLALPNANVYFPDLTLKPRGDGMMCVHRIDQNGNAINIEEARMVARPNGTREKQIPDFMKYLNSDPARVDRAEETAAARLILWCEEDEAARMTQIHLAMETAKKKLRLARTKIASFDGRDWRIALWINDILHQGRAKYSAMEEALRSGDPVEALSRLGASRYDGRKRTVRECVRQLEGENILDNWQADLEPAPLVTPIAA